MSISGIYSLNNEVISGSETILSTAFIDIDLKEYTIEEGEEKIFSGEGGYVVPGDIISIIPRVNNLGSQCYLRTKITYFIGNEQLNEADYIDGNFKSFTKVGDYYYDETPLDENSAIDIFDSINIPTDLSKEYQGEEIVINVSVEAVQAKNFEPDYSLDDPWLGVEITEALSRSYEVDPDGSSTVVYENNAQEYLTLSEDFFGDLGKMLPGDVVSENVGIKNSSKNKLIFNLSVETGELSTEDSKILEGLELVIKNQNGEIISKKNLNEVKGVLLAMLETSETENLTMEVSLPKEYGNEFSKLLAKVVWKFSLEEIPDGNNVNPNTRDFKFDLSITVFFISAIGLVVVLWLIKKESENIENK